jgi:hypothetical protein
MKNERDMSMEFEKNVRLQSALQIQKREQAREIVRQHRENMGDQQWAALKAHLEPMISQELIRQATRSPIMAIVPVVERMAGVREKGIHIGRLCAVAMDMELELAAQGKSFVFTEGGVSLS